MTEISQRQAELIKHLSGKNLSVEQLSQMEAISGIQDSTKEQVTAVTETVEVDPRLTKFAEMYNKWSAVSQSRMDWKTVQTAMLANDGALLKQVEAIPHGPIMFGAKDGNILFANGGEDLILTNVSYSDSRKVVQAIGLELFPCVHAYEKTEEILMFEEFTGEPIVKTGSTWLDNGGEDLGWSRIAGFDKKKQCSQVYQGTDFASGAFPFIGIRGLLRAKA